MTFSDIESRSKSTIHAPKLWLGVGNIYAQLEDTSFIITQVIMYSMKLGQWPMATLKVGQGQPYKNWKCGLWEQTFMQNCENLEPLLNEILCEIWNNINDL